MVMTMAAFHIAALVAAMTTLAAAAVSDVRRYRIPNSLCAVLLGLFPLFLLTAPQEIDWKQHVMVFGLVLASGFAMFLGHLAGAGDIKLIAVTSLWAGPHLVAVFIVTTALAGGVLALALALRTHMRNRSRKPGVEPVPVARVPIPYGVAIAIGGINVMLQLTQPILFPT